MTKKSNLQPFVTSLLGVGTAIALVVFYLSVNPAFPRSIDGPDMAPTKDDMQITDGTTEANNTSIESHDKEEEHPGLEDLIREAAMEDGTVIMAAINEAWAAPNSLFDLLLESFRVGENVEHLLKHMIVIAMDPRAFERSKSLHPYCYLLKVKGVDFTAEKAYRSKDYLTLMWSRNKLQRRILELGYNFLFTDTDIIWFRDPFPYISAIAHITISSDIFFGNPDDLANWANGGLIYVKSSKKTIEFCKQWYATRLNYPGEHEEYVFEQIKRELAPLVGVKMRFLGTFQAGELCQPIMNFDTLCTFHATCRECLLVKLQELRRVLDDWKKYKA